MATELWRNKSGTVSVDAYVGPAREDGGNRRRVQITVISDQDGKHHSASLSAEEWREFVREMQEQ